MVVFQARPVWPFLEDVGAEYGLFAHTMNASGIGGGPQTVTQAALAVNGSENVRGEVNMTELRRQVVTSHVVHTASV